MTINNYKMLKVENLENAITLVSINREDKLNALNEEVLDELFHFFTHVNAQETRGVILTGSGEKAFIAGADIGGMSEMNMEDGLKFSQRGQEVSLAIEKAPMPVIAAVNGFALGGGLEMALSCDFILASENAVLGLPEVSLGLIPGFGGTQRLSKIIGRNKAKELIYTGRKILVDEAHHLGLVLRVLQDKKALIEEAQTLMKKILRNSPYAISQAKKVINQGVDLTVEQGLNKEREVFSAIFSSYDMKEGTKAFVEKRKPVFKGQ